MFIPLKTKSGKHSTNVAGIDLRSLRPPGHAKYLPDDEGVPHVHHLVVSHVYGVSDVPPGSEPAEQQKKMDLDPDSSSAMTCVWWRNPNIVQAPNKGSPMKEGERERTQLH